MTYFYLVLFITVYFSIWGYLMLLGVRDIADELKLLRQTMETLSNQFQHFIKFGHK